MQQIPYKKVIRYFAQCDVDDEDIEQAITEKYSILTLEFDEIHYMPNNTFLKLGELVVTKLHIKNMDPNSNKFHILCYIIKNHHLLIEVDVDFRPDAEDIVYQKRFLSLACLPSKGAGETLQIGYKPSAASKHLEALLCRNMNRIILDNVALAHGLSPVCEKLLFHLWITNNQHCSYFSTLNSIYLEIDIAPPGDVDAEINIPKHKYLKHLLSLSGRS